MKSRWSSFSYQDYEQLEISFGLASFLEKLDIKSSTELADDIYNMMDEYCESCHVIKDDCECRHREDYNDYNYDVDRLYDEWKDRRLEEQNET
jgi:hypothetical protein